MAVISQNSRTRTRAVVLLLFIAVALLGFASPHLIATKASPAFEPLQQQNSQPKRPQRGRRRKPISAAQQQPRINYSNFSHQSAAHQKPCDSCHKFPSANWKEVRKGDAAFPDVTEYPQHPSCIGCHQQQFFSGAQPTICSVCHVNIGPRNPVRFPFPSLGEPFYASKRGPTFVSDFRINFPHAKHMDLVGQAQPGTTEDATAREVRASHGRRIIAQDADKKCAMCHETYQPQGKSNEEYVTKPPKDLGDKFWLKKGTFKSILLTHATCFTCHSQDSGITPAPTDCNTCHKLATPQNTPAATDFDPKLAGAMGVTDNILLMEWRKRQSAGAFRHEGGAHPDLSCSVCHKVDAMSTLEPKTQKVSISSCADCHVTATSSDGGALNLEIDQRKANPSFQCSKCHVVFGRAPIPASHLNAIPAAKAK